MRSRMHAMPSRRKFISLAALGTVFLTFPGLSSLTSCSDDSQNEELPSDTPDMEYATLVTFLFDTVIEIKAACNQALLDGLEERLVFFENTLSRTIEGSDIYTINHALGGPVTVEPETAELISIALDYSELSGGLFDITIGSVIELWDFEAGILPNTDKLSEALTHVDYRTVSVDGLEVRVSDPEAQLDLGGIAKGYIADEAARFLREGGCTSAFIDLGGNIYTLGEKNDGSSWRIGIQDPNDVRGSILAIVEESDKSIVSSGINERSFEKDGVLYHHLLDPKTGMPAQTGLSGISIVSDLSVDGDALSTIAFLLGEEEGASFIDGLASSQDKDLQWIFIANDGSTSSSKNLELSEV